MTDESLITQVWPDWSVIELIGSGTHGSVYAVRRDDVPDMEAAVKVIPIPMNPAETIALSNEGFTDEEIIEYFRKETEDQTSEIQMMKKYQGMSHFVCLEDYQVITRQDGSLGFWILIRMEKLQSLPSWICDKTLSEKEIIDLGIQLCEALTDCHADHIIHRDIKPANIFVKSHSDSGCIYKLGDFGVCRKGIAREHAENQKSIKGIHWIHAAEAAICEEFVRTLGKLKHSGFPIVSFTQYVALLEKVQCKKIIACWQAFIG